MSEELDNVTDDALANLFSIPADIGTTDTIEVHWSDALTPKPSATQTLRLERDVQEQPVQAMRSKRLGKPGETDVDYEVGPLLAKGGGGRVFEGKQVSTGRLIALKRLSPEWAFDPAMRTRFLREGILAAGFTHPHLLTVIEVGVDQDGFPFIAMPRVEGVPWSRSIGERSRKDNLTILAKLADAVFCLHSHGVIHRDIKPANVLLGPVGEVWLTDWGLAARLPDPGRGRGLPDDAASGGTPAYMSPEMARDERSLVGFASDVFLLGAVLREILTGKPPHAADSAVESLQLAAKSLYPRPPIRGGLPALVSVALKAEPTERPTLSEFVATLQHVLRSSLRTRIFYLFAGVVAIAALCLAYAFLVYRDYSPSRETIPAHSVTSLQETREKSETQLDEIRKQMNAIRDMSLEEVALGGRDLPRNASDNAEQKLLGKHMFSLQWILFQKEKFGTASVTRNNDGGLYVDARQELNGDYVTLNGDVRVVNAKEFIVTGELVTCVSSNNSGKPCIRHGTFTFKATGDRKYWRMQERVNPCANVADYVDIYF